MAYNAGGPLLRFYVEELEGLFEELLDYYRLLLRLESKLRSMGGGEGLVEVLRWRMAIARLLVEQRRLISSMRDGRMIEARSEACMVNDMVVKLSRDAPDPSISLHVLPLIAYIYEVSRAICDYQGS
jgi:hypothetical protein